MPLPGSSLPVPEDRSVLRPGGGRVPGPSGWPLHALPGRPRPIRPCGGGAGECVGDAVPPRGDGQTEVGGHPPCRGPRRRRGRTMVRRESLRRSPAPTHAGTAPGFGGASARRTSLDGGSDPRAGRDATVGALDDARRGKSVMGDLVDEPGPRHPGRPGCHPRSGLSSRPDPGCRRGRWAVGRAPVVGACRKPFRRPGTRSSGNPGDPQSPTHDFARTGGASR